MVRRIPSSVVTARVFLAVCLLALAGGARDACAGRSEAPLQVTARVPVHLDVRVTGETPAVVLTADDLAAGVKDIPGGWVLAVRTNSDLGYVLELGLPDADWLAGVEVRAFGAAADGPPGGVARIAVPGFANGESISAVDLRLRLAPGARAGTYSVPLALGVSPL